MGNTTVLDLVQERGCICQGGFGVGLGRERRSQPLDRHPLAVHPPAGPAFWDASGMEKAEDLVQSILVSYVWYGCDSDVSESGAMLTALSADTCTRGCMSA